MTIKSKLLTSVAALTIASGAAFAQTATTGTTLETDTEITADTNAEVGADTNVAANPYAPGWNEDLDARYGDIADRQIAELIGMNVVTEGGDDVGEVDNFVLMQDELKAVVGVGGFLGMGEHEVALSLSDLTYNGDMLIVPFTAEELKAMPEYTEELEQLALNPEDTLRLRNGMEAASDANPDMAATQLETDDSAAEEMAENAEGEVEQEAEELAAEADAAVEEGTQEVAEAADATADAVEGAAADTEQMAENIDEQVEEQTEDLAQVTEETENAVDDAVANAEQTANNAAESTSDWFQKIDAEFAEISDWEINELEGKQVASADGNIIGEVDDLGMHNNKLVAVVGIGGFLGLGEHDVALDLANLSWDGEKFIAEGYTEEELKGMAEYDPAMLEPLADDTTLRAQANM